MIQCCVLLFLVVSGVHLLVGNVNNKQRACYSPFKSYSRDWKVSLLVPKGACNHDEKTEADTYGITVVDAKRRFAFNRLVWLSSPHKDNVLDIVVGHGVKLHQRFCSISK